MSDAQPSAALLRAISDEPQSTRPDKLDRLRDECRRVRDDDVELADLEARLEEVRARRTMRLRETIPDLMDQCGVPSISLAAEGNLPAVEIAIRPHYSANIAAAWPEEKRLAGFAAVEACDGRDLIKTTLTVFFPREHRDGALQMMEQLRAASHDVEVKEAISSQTLTKWLSERHKAGLSLPPLELIGGFVGRIAAMRPSRSRKI